MAEADSRFIRGPDGRLDSRWHGPERGPPVLLLHPHPNFGGTMGSRVVYDLAVALADAGWRAARFDFRGVGRSEGKYADGVGEAEDAAAVFDELARASGRPPAVVGYSFGGAVACRAATLRVPKRLVLIGTPLDVTASALHPRADAPAVRCPAHLVVGDRDPHVSVEQASDLSRAFSPPAGITVVGGAGHFLEPGEAGRAVEAVLNLFA